jgi:hypothetical protein
MSITNIMPTGYDELGNPLHKVLETRAGRDIFKMVKIVIDGHKKRSGEAILDWGEVYRNLLLQYMDGLDEKFADDFSCALSEDELLKLEQNFLRDFMNIEMRDTLFDDVQNGDGFRSVSSVAGEVNVWTAGDTVNRHQENKLVRAEIFRLIHETLAEINLPTRCNDIIADEKASRLYDALEYFVKSKGTSDIVVAIFDDKTGALVKAFRDIERWRKEREVKGETINIHPLFIRAMRGRHGHESWPDIYPLPKHEANDLNDVASLIEQEQKQHKIPREHTMAFLDFDGAMSDNRLMRLRQAHVMYTNIMKAIKLATGNYLQERDGVEVSNQTELNALIRENSDDVWEIYNNVVKPPHQYLNEILRKIEIDMKNALPDETIETLYEIDNWLMKSGFANPNIKADDLRALFIEKWNGTIEGEDFPKPNIDFKGRTKFIDEAYYNNGNRKTIIENEEYIVSLLFGDQEREMAINLAKDFEKNFIKWAIHFDRGNSDFFSGGVKSKSSMIKNIIGNNSKHGDMEALLKIQDLVRGFAIADSETFTTSLCELDEMVHILTGDSFEHMVVGFNNYYAQPYAVSDDGAAKKPLLGYRIAYKLSDAVAYELQLQTKLAAAAGKLDHDTLYKKYVPVTADQEDYIKKVGWAAHIMDLEEAQRYAKQEMEQCDAMQRELEEEQHSDYADYQNWEEYQCG